MRKLKVIGLLVTLAAACEVTQAQSVTDYPASFGYSNVLMTSTGTVAWAAQPKRLWVDFSARAAMTNDVYVAFSTNATLAAYTGILLKFSPQTDATNSTVVVIPPQRSYRLPATVTGFGNIVLRFSNSATNLDTYITTVEARKP